MIVGCEVILASRSSTPHVASDRASQQIAALFPPRKRSGWGKEEDRDQEFPMLKTLNLYSQANVPYAYTYREAPERKCFVKMKRCT